MLQRSPSLTEQVKLYIKQRIVNSEFEGGRVPSETDLASQLNVSRTTIRDALSRLETEGVIFRKQGAGTFVNQTGLLVKTRLEAIVLYENLIREHGYVPSVHLLRAEEQPAEPAVAAQLNLQPGEKLLMTEKLFKADATPVISLLTQIPRSLIRQPYTFDDCQLPVFEFLPRFCQKPMAYFLCDRGWRHVFRAAISSGGVDRPHHADRKRRSRGDCTRCRTPKP